MYEIPVLHPLIVHFPIALLTVTPIAVLIWSYTQQRPWLGASLLLSALGAIGATAANLSGETMEEQSAGIPAVQALVETHELTGQITMIAAWVLVAGLVFALLSKKARETGTYPAWLRFAAIALATGTALVAAYTGHLGGQMTWGVPV